MHSKLLFLFFILLSVLLISITLLFVGKPFYAKQLEEKRVASIQINYEKHYFKRRDSHIPIRSTYFAQKKINQLIEKSISTQTLRKVIDVLNNMNETAVLQIEVYKNDKKSKKENFYLSQKEANRLKVYISKQTNLAFISAIGYVKGKNETIEFKLKRIKS